MAIDPTIALGVQQPNTTQTLSSMLGLKTQIQGQQLQQQALQAGSMQNQQNAIDLQETQNAQGLLKNIKNYQDPQGNIDFNKLAPDLASAAPKNFAAFMKPLLAVQQAHTEASQSINTLDAQSRGQVGSVLYSLKGQSPDVVAKTLDTLSTSYPTLAPAVSYFQKQIGPALQANSQPAIDSALDSAGKQLVPPSTQQEMNTPSVSTVNDNSTTKGVNIKPGVAGLPMGATVPGTTATMQLPPTQPTIAPNGQPGVIGPASGSAGNPQQPGDTASGIDAQIDAVRTNGGQPISPQDQPAIDREVARLQAKKSSLSGQGGATPGFVPTALPPGQVQNIADNVDQMGKHYASLQDKASGTQLATSLTGNVKALAQRAITGTDSDKLAYVNGLLAHLPGFTGAPSTDLKTATDLLEKNLSQLNLSTPASSDAARSLVTAARPHSSMTPEAISEATDQLSGQVKANMAVRNFLTPYKFANGGAGDPNGYQAARQQIEQTADPRIWQLDGKSPQEQQKFMQSLTPADRNALVKKAQQLHQMGIIQ